MATQTFADLALYNSVVTQSQIMHPALNVSAAAFVDVNPTYDPKTSPAHLLTDSYAILYGSISNLIMCPAGARGKIFQEDYYCGLLSLLQEPFDGITANLIAMTLNTAIKQWEPRLANITVDVSPVDNPASYLVNVTADIVSLSNKSFSASYSIPVGQG